MDDISACLLTDTIETNFVQSYLLRESEMLKMDRGKRKNATKKRQKLVIEFDERKRAYVKCISKCLFAFTFT